MKTLKTIFFEGDSKTTNPVVAKSYEKPKITLVVGFISATPSRNPTGQKVFVPTQTLIVVKLLNLCQAPSTPILAVVQPEMPLAWIVKGQGKANKTVKTISSCHGCLSIDLYHYSIGIF